MSIDDGGILNEDIHLSDDDSNTASLGSRVSGRFRCIILWLIFMNSS